MISLAMVSLFVILASSVLLYIGVVTIGWLQFRDRVLVTLTMTLTYVLVLRVEPSWWWVSNAAVIAMAVVVGAMLGSTLHSRAAVVAFCVAAAVVDVLSFSGGLTRTIVESYRSGDSRLLAYLSVAFPVGGSVRPIVGIGDLVIVAGLFAGFGHLRFSGWLPFAVPVGGLLLALGLGLAIGGAPALPFIAVATVVYVLSRWNQTLPSNTYKASPR